MKGEDKWFSRLAKTLCGLISRKRSTVVRVERSQTISLMGQSSVHFTAKPGGTCIAEDGTFSGALVARGEQLVVSGRVTGELHQTRRGAQLLVNKGARINGRVVSSELHLHGAAIGQIQVQHVCIGVGGSVSGAVEYHTIEVNGSLGSTELIPKDYRNQLQPTKGVTRI